MQSTEINLTTLALLVSRAESSGFMLDCLGLYARTRITKITDCPVQTSAYSTYFTVRNATNSNSLILAEEYLSRIRASASANDDFDEAAYSEIENIYRAKLKSELVQNSAKFRRNEERSKQEEIARIKKAQTLDAMFEIDTFESLLTHVRTYFHTHGDSKELRAFLSPHKELSHNTMYLWEKPREHRGANLIKREYLDRALMYFEFSVSDDPQQAANEYQILQKLEDLWVKRARSALAEKYKSHSAEDTENIVKYACHLALTAGHKLVDLKDASLQPAIHNKLAPKAYNKVVELLRHPKEPIGRPITEAEFAKLETLFQLQRGMLDFENLVEKDTWGERVAKPAKKEELSIR